jgi:serine/threonine protein kinase
MAVELFTDGHVSKASDVFAFGILLYEIVTGQSAYAGVPISLLPHRVAVEGLRPTWPTGVSCEMMRLAESCWVAKPQRR